MNDADHSGGPVISPEFSPSEMPVTSSEEKNKFDDWYGSMFEIDVGSVGGGLFDVQEPQTEGEVGTTSQANETPFSIPQSEVMLQNTELPPSGMFVLRYIY